MIAIGLDPSVRGFGWAVVGGHAVWGAGVWQTEKDGTLGAKDDQAVRFTALAQELSRLVKAEVEREAQAPDALVLFVEGTTLQAQKSRWNASMLGRARGLVDGVAAAFMLEVFEVGSDERKRIVPFATRQTKVSKGQVRAAVLELYPAADRWCPDTSIGLNASDAIALAHVGSELWRFRSQLKSARSGP